MKRHPSRRLSRGILLATTIVLGAGGALAADIRVTDFDDVVDDADGSCTLREAVRSANGDVGIDQCTQGDGDDRILLAAGTYTLDLGNGTGEDNSLDGDLDLLGPLEIRGVSSGYTVIDGVAEQSTERVLHAIDSIALVVIRNLRITGGTAEIGGGIRIEDTASMTLLDTAVDNAKAEVGGGIFNDGTLALIRTRVENNRASGTGGGISTIGTFSASNSLVTHNFAEQRGGGVAAEDGGTIRINRSTIADNEGQEAGGGLWISFISEFDLFYSRVEGNRAGMGGGLFVEGDGTYQVQHSALISNTASAQGGGLYASGIVFVRHSTVALNTAPEGGGGGAFSNGDNVLFDSATIAGNTGGGVFNDSGAFFEFSLLADNDGGNCLGNAPGAGKLNLDDGNTCQFPTNDPNNPQLVNTDPMLGPLADNNGPTPTFALLADSPAIDAISQADKPNCGLTMGPSPPDQRGYPRGYPPSMVNGQLVFLCDIGAFEAHAPYVVDSTADEVDNDGTDGRCLTASGACTLRAAIQQANATPGLEEITVPAGTFALTLAGTSENEAATGDLDVLDPVLITGAGMEQTLVDGQQMDRVFDVLRPGINSAGPHPQTHVFSDMTIRNGTADTAGGGGMRISRRPVRLERTIFSDNISEGPGGGVRCVEFCDTVVLDSRFTGNMGQYGGGIVVQEDGGEPGPILIERSEFTGNSASSEGGAIAGLDLTLRNTTISGNHVTDADASNPTMGVAGGVAAPFGVIENSTIVANTAAAEGGGGGIGLGMVSSVITGTLLAENESGAAGEPDNCLFLPTAPSIASGGYNLSDTEAVDCNLDQPTDLPLMDPLLGPMADNGGLTRTRALLPGSPAIDTGDDAKCPLTDQRGFFRPEDGDGDGTASCDIGAFEALGADLAIAISDSPDPAAVDDDVTYTITITNNGPGAATGVQVSASLPAELSFVSADAGAGSCSESGSTIGCEAGDVPAGESVDTTIVATAVQSGSVSVSANVTAAEADAMPSDNSVSETTTVTAGGGGSGGGGSGGSGGGGAPAPLLLAMLGLSLLFSVRLRCANSPLIAGAMRWSICQS